MLYRLGVDLVLCVSKVDTCDRLPFVRAEDSHFRAQNLAYLVQEMALHERSVQSSSVLNSG